MLQLDCNYLCTACQFAKAFFSWKADAKVVLFNIRNKYIVLFFLCFCVLIGKGLIHKEVIGWIFFDYLDGGGKGEGIIHYYI